MNKIVLYITILLLCLFIISEIVVFLTINKDDGPSPVEKDKFSSINDLLKHYLGETWPLTILLIAVLVVAFIYFIHSSYTKNSGKDGTSISPTMWKYVVFPGLILFNILMVIGIIKIYLDISKSTNKNAKNTKNIKTIGLVLGSILLIGLMIGVIIYLIKYIKK